MVFRHPLLILSLERCTSRGYVDTWTRVGYVLDTYIGGLVLTNRSKTSVRKHMRTVTVLQLRLFVCRLCLPLFTYQCATRCLHCTPLKLVGQVSPVLILAFR